MVNRTAAEFVKRLVAAFSRWPAGKDTVDLYTEKLSKWKLTQAQWDRALDALIERRQDENLPGLSEIYHALGNVSRADRALGGLNHAWISFLHNGRHHVMRAYNDQGVWVIASLRGRDARGNVIELQNHVGEAAALHIPRNATDIVCSPDNPAKPDPRDMPTREERAEMFAEMERFSRGCGRRIA